jgi:hypothetical protein
MAEFQSKNLQLDFQGIPFGDSVLLSYVEVVGPNRNRVKEVKWVSKEGKMRDLYCPQNVFAVESEEGKIYHYYREGKALKAFELAAGSETMVGLPESIEFNDVIILASYVDENLFFILLNEDGTEMSVMEVAAMRIVKTTIYKLPIGLNEFIKKNTYIEFYDELLLDSFKGRARVKIFRYGNKLSLLIDDKQVEPTKKQPHVTHLLSFNEGGSVTHKVISMDGKADFGTFLFDNKLFQSRIAKDKFSMSVYDLSGNELMKYEAIADSIDTGKKDSVKVNYRWGRENFQGWDTFRRTFKTAGSCDPIITVSGTSQNYTIQWGTYFNDKPVGTYAGGTPLTAMITFFITTAIRQVSEGPGMSRYIYFETDLNKGKILPVEQPPAGLLRAKIDEYERSKQVKNKSPFESKSYIPFGDGVVAIYHLKPERMIGVTQLVYFN